jgi:hypothetical protein
MKVAPCIIVNFHHAKNVNSQAQLSLSLSFKRQLSPLFHCVALSVCVLCAHKSDTEEENLFLCVKEIYKQNMLVRQKPKQ